MNWRNPVIWVVALACIGGISGVIAFVVIRNTGTSGTIDYDAEFCQPIVIAHRGSSGYVPEHTLGAYALAVTMGADYIEPDVVMTKDGQLICRHDNELGLTTDVSQHPEFTARYRTQTVDGFNISGWFTEDFTLAEVKTLRSIERIAMIRPGNARMDYAFDVPTFQEVIDLAKGMEISESRRIGIIPEIKHSTHFQRLGLPMEKILVDIFQQNGYIGPEAPAYIQSFEISNLRELKTITDIRLVQLFSASPQRQPFDQAVLGTTITYADMATADGLREIATYAYSVGPDKSYIIPRDGNNNLGTPTTFVADAHAVGLKVHPYTFRSESAFLPAEFQVADTSLAAIGDFIGELRAFLDTGIDGLFADQPDAAVRARGTCRVGQNTI